MNYRARTLYRRPCQFSPAIEGTGEAEEEGKLDDRQTIDPKQRGSLNFIVRQQEAACNFCYVLFSLARCFVNKITLFTGDLTSSQGLCNIGEWHSHHRLGLAKPSHGDQNTVWKHLPTIAGGRFIVFIANISRRPGKVSIQKTHEQVFQSFVMDIFKKIRLG